MDKKEIFEHLADIYLDASLKKKKKSRKFSRFQTPGLIAALAVSLFTILLFYKSPKKSLLEPQVALVISSEAAKINFNFDPAKKEVYSIDLKRLNLVAYKRLGFSVKKSHYADNLRLRVEFANGFKEESEVYIQEIPSQWKDYQINFSEFKKIGNWQDMQNLSFIVEEWNVEKKKGVVYIDNIRFLK